MNKLLANRYKNLFLFSFLLFCMLTIFFNKVNNLDELLLLLVFISYIFIIFFLFYSYTIKDLYSPPAFFLFFLLMYEMPKYSFYLSLDTPENLLHSTKLISHKFIQKNIIYANIEYILFSMFCVFMYILGYFMVNNPKRRKYKQKNINIRKLKKVYYISLIIGLLILFYLVADHGIFYILSRRSGVEEASEAIKGNYYLILLGSIHLLLYPLALYFNIFKKSYKSIFIFILSASIVFLLTGSRGMIIYTFIISLLLVIYKKGMNIKIFSILLLLATSFSIMGFLRTIDFNEIKGVDSLLTMYTKDSDTNRGLSGYQLQMRDEMIFEYMNKVNYGLGSSYLAVPTNIIPRVLLGELKPNMLDGELAKKFWNLNDIGLPSNSTTEAYYNFGYLGIFFFLIIGILSKKIYLWVLSQSDFIKVTYLTLIINMGILSSTRLIYSFHYLIIFYFIYLYVKERAKIDINHNR